VETNATVSAATEFPWFLFRSSRKTSNPVSRKTDSVSILFPTGTVTFPFGFGMSAYNLLLLRDISSFSRQTETADDRKLKGFETNEEHGFLAGFCLATNHSRKATLLFRQ
jgi:hypothetical protein